MTKWYDRIGNTIEMNIDNQWIKGTIINGYRTHDGLINMKTEDGKNCWCGINGEYVHFRKCDDSLGDLLTYADKIRSMTDEELAKERVDCVNDTIDGEIIPGRYSYVARSGGWFSTKKRNSNIFKLKLKSNNERNVQLIKMEASNVLREDKERRFIIYKRD